MGKQYILFFDSGTSNTRSYLLNDSFEICYTERVNVGSKDAAIEGSNKIILNTICSLYRAALKANVLKDEDISAVYASGMVTSPYGLKEVEHLKVPVSVASFAENLYSYYEGTDIKREIFLVPGIKTENDDFSFVGNMRGEEIEILGVLDELKDRGIESAALVLPGSHTHICYVKDDTFCDILSTFTGELFYALGRETILSPILERGSDEIDRQMISMAMNNLRRFGFNRAIYIAHAMRVMNRYTPQQRYSYCEGVINGGVRQALEYYLHTRWTDCQAVAFICTEYMYKLLNCIFAGSEFEKKIVWFPLTPSSCYAVKGLKRIVEEKWRN